MNLNNAKIAIIGLGYVGLPLVVEFDKLRKVLGFDINANRIAELQSGRDSTLEVDPQDLVAASQLQFSSHAADLQNCQVFIITVPTPVDQANRPDLIPLIRASETVGKALKAMHPPPHPAATARNPAGQAAPIHCHCPPEAGP